MPGLPACLNHALTVIAAAGSRALLSSTLICPLKPSKPTALPEIPRTHVVPPERTPLLPLPEPSVTVVPLPSSSFQIPTGPSGAERGGGGERRDDKNKRGEGEAIQHLRH